MPSIVGIHTSGLPIGIPLPHAGPQAKLPAKTLLCDGATYPVATYPALFNVIGNQYGGDGITTFSVPDIRGRSPICMDNMTSLGSTQGAAGRVVNAQASLRGGSMGEENHLLAVSEMPSHSHNLTINGASVFQAATSGSGANNQNNTNGANTGGQLWTNQNTGGGGTHNNMQPSMAFPYIIAYG
jgi:microcystin-dependent protein